MTHLDSFDFDSELFKDKSLGNIDVSAYDDLIALVSEKNDEQLATTTNNDIEVPKEPTTNDIEGPKETTTNDIEGPKEPTTNDIEGPKETTTNDIEGPKETTTNDIEGPKETTTNKDEDIQEPDETMSEYNDTRDYTVPPEDEHILDEIMNTDLSKVYPSVVTTQTSTPIEATAPVQNEAIQSEPMEVDMLNAAAELSDDLSNMMAALYLEPVDHNVLSLPLFLEGSLTAQEMILCSRLRAVKKNSHSCYEVEQGLFRLMQPLLAESDRNKPIMDKAIAAIFRSLPTYVIPEDLHSDITPQEIDMCKWFRTLNPQASGAHSELIQDKHIPEECKAMLSKLDHAVSLSNLVHCYNISQKEQLKEPIRYAKDEINTIFKSLLERNTTSTTRATLCLADNILKTRYDLRYNEAMEQMYYANKIESYKTLRSYYQSSHNPNKVTWFAGNEKSYGCYVEKSELLCMICNKAIGDAGGGNYNRHLMKVHKLFYNMLAVNCGKTTLEKIDETDRDKVYTHVFFNQPCDCDYCVACVPIGKKKRKA
jgi:hypothetical protein